MSARNLSNVIALYVVMIILLCDGLLSQRAKRPYNPCPETFTYIFNGNENFGIIKQVNTSKTRNQITIGLSQPGILNQSFKGKIRPNIDLNKISEYINLGLPITYRVDFPQQEVLPRVAFIIGNGIRICSGPIDPFPRADIKITIVLEEDKKSEELRTLNSVCGQENPQITRLRKRAILGEFFEKSRFPWIAAIYKRKKNTGVSFECGGTLISKRTVISAAFCFYEEQRQHKGEQFFVSLGRHELNDYQSGLNIEIRNIIIHPDYRGESDNYDACIAIAQLAESVTFSHEIRPICLWEGQSDLDLIKDNTGITVGWGEDGTYLGTTSFPKLVRPKIVSQSDCLLSNAAFSQLISNRTFCAGNRDGSGPCTGDSGNGLMMKQRSRWTLRGIVSAGLTTSTQTCNLQEYVVYTDVAKFVDWIEENMLLV